MSDNAPADKGLPDAPAPGGGEEEDRHSGPDGEQTGAGAAASDGSGKARAPVDPTRYGDWEKNGRCIDF